MAVDTLLVLLILVIGMASFLLGTSTLTVPVAAVEVTVDPDDTAYVNVVVDGTDNTNT